MPASVSAPASFLLCWASLAVIERWSARETVSPGSWPGAGVGAWWPPPTTAWQSAWTSADKGVLMIEEHTDPTAEAHAQASNLLRTLLTALATVADRRAQRRQADQESQRHQSEAERRELEKRIEAERESAYLVYRRVYDESWWASPSPRKVADAVVAAGTWAGDDPEHVTPGRNFPSNCGPVTASTSTRWPANMRARMARSSKLLRTSVSKSSKHNRAVPRPRSPVLAPGPGAQQGKLRLRPGAGRPTWYRSPAPSSAPRSSPPRLGTTYRTVSTSTRQQARTPWGICPKPLPRAGWRLPTTSLVSSSAV